MFCLMYRRPTSSPLLRCTTLSRSRTTLLPVDQSGVLLPSRLSDVILDDTALVSVMHANNETIAVSSRITSLNRDGRSEEHTSELQSQSNIVSRLLLATPRSSRRSS